MTRSACGRIATAWVVGIACVWAVLVALVGAGDFTALVTYSGLNLPVLLWPYSGTPEMAAGAAAAAFLLSLTCVTLLRAPRISWVAFPIGQVALLTVDWLVAAPRLAVRARPIHAFFLGPGPLNIVTRGGAFTMFLGSDVVIAILCTAAAAAGGYLGFAWRLRRERFAQQALPAVARHGQ